MRIAFVALSAPGHLNPTTALARQLQSRDHEVIVISLPDAEPYVRAAGLAFLPYCENVYSPDSSNEIRRQMSKLQGEDALRFTIQSLGGLMEVTLNSLPAKLAAAGADAVVLDTYQFYLELIPMSLGLPYVHVSNALHFDYSGYTPLCVYDWPHEATAAALARNRKGVANLTQMLKQANAGVRGYAERAGLKIDWDNPAATISKLGWITQTPKEFDFESSHWPTQFRHTGPFHDGNGRIEVDFPWERLTGEPLIYASMGTVQTSLANVFHAIAAAATKRKDFQLVLSVGNTLEPEQIGPAPSNAIIVKHAPQLEILKQASVCVTHAGLNTVLEALAQGVPQVAIPVTNDQPGVAARIANKKTGLFAPLKDLSATRLSVLLDEVLNDSSYRDNARQFQKIIADSNGLSVAADLLEQAFGLTKKNGKPANKER
jgi:zeaxanthin glucosyltransferase